VKVKHLLLLVCFLLLESFPSRVCANPWNGKVVLQGFWWDYWNNNYPNNWSTYLADLAPRLREMGIDAVWIPPTVKNKNATGSVGYSPFDHYDLGDKFQGGSTATRFGTKDQYLRAVAVLHANGIEVIQDLVWNHMDGAGSDMGAGGQDPAAPSNKFKNFRYACFVSPGTANTATNYVARSGRFPKNWQNFHPNPDHNTEGDDITAGFFGPDICYYQNAQGLSSNCSYNPPQSTDYMRNGIRIWSIWLKKQTAVDGFRLDAVKHFETWAAKDFVWNLANNAGFASGGPQMYAVGEYIGSAGEIDAWVDNVNSSDGFSDVVGSFDVSLRGAIKSMVSSLGAYNLGSIPGAQQNRRNRTAPYVNSHDTFRPILSASGNYMGWDAANELGGHIDPSDPRIQAAYAITMAVDGSPTVFFEDLFDIGGSGQRWTHDPQSATQLPARDWLVNLVWCHQKLNFKDGAYRVRWQDADLLIIERSARAIIGVNDTWDTWQSATVQTDFGANVQLHDYSGANGNDISTDGSGRATFSVPPCNGSNVRRGYCVWGPTGVTGGFNPSTRSTTQEWEMADDLGDSHPNSLQQGGALPASSIAQRTVGKIYPLPGTTVTVNLFPEKPTNTVVLRLLNQSNIEMTNVTGSGALTLTYTAPVAEFLTLRLQNTSTANAEQRIYVKATYTAPRNLRAPPVLTQAALTPNAEFRFSVAERQGFNYVVEASTNLTGWLSLQTNVAPFIFVDGAPTNLPVRFYRARYGP
jgi:alpha-amylase